MPTIDIRGRMQLVDINRVLPNAYNYNEMSEKSLDRARQALREFGVVRAILVRQIAGGKFEIVDGEHRWKLLKAEGATQCPVRNLGEVSATEARALTVTMNEIRGQQDYIKMADLFASIKDYSTEAMASMLPFAAEEITSMIEAASFDWSAYDFGPGETPPEDMVSEYATITCRVQQEDADLIDRKAAALCEKYGIRSDKEGVQRGMLFTHLLEQRRQGGVA